MTPTHPRMWYTHVKQVFLQEKAPMSILTDSYFGWTLSWLCVDTFKLKDIIISTKIMLNDNYKLKPCILSSHESATLTCLTHKPLL